MYDDTYVDTYEDVHLPRPHGHLGTPEQNVFSTLGKGRDVTHRRKDVVSFSLGVSTDKTQHLSPREI